MKEYIDREALLEEDFTDMFVNSYDANVIFPNIIEAAPSAKVAPIAYAYWDWQCDGTHFCSECGSSALFNHYGEELCTVWCPACGCFMTEVRYEDE